MQQGAPGELACMRSGATTCDYLAQMFLSLLNAPGSWNLSDRSEVRTLVRSQLLGGVRQPQPSG